MKNIESADYRVAGRISLKSVPTVPDFEISEDDGKDLLKDLAENIGKFQERMYAQNRYSVLICLQGMDTSGKDSLIREVFSEINPRGVVVHSFKTPTSSELEHDYLWRHYLALPEKGKIAVFNRTHYENVLVTRVHPEYLLNENLPEISSVDDVSDEFWHSRMEQMKNFERHLVENGTIVIKLFLHLSKEEQRQRLLRRLDEAKHNWKFSPNDLKERERWDDYMLCYEDAINRTSTDIAPWHVIPADDKLSTRIIAAKLIADELEKYPQVQFPELDEKIQERVSEYRRALEQE
ncbi:MAG: polyphosphate kinase 2 family protein [Flavobacterium sp.]|nr:MAG: polyphosphate kinase 2 family protein [Flavobacterium sp.]